MKQFSPKWMAARAWYTAGRTFEWQCPTCGANSLTMADKCSAPLEEACPGFERVEEVHKEFEANCRQFTPYG